MAAEDLVTLLQPNVQEMIETLQRHGYRILKDDPFAPTTPKALHLAAAERWDGTQTLRFGVVSDTHLGSRQQQLTLLGMVYERFAARGIEAVFHVGDLVDGDGRVYPGQEYDLFLHGFDKQLEYAMTKYPRREGIVTYVIAGNHDLSFKQRGGADILANLARERQDIVYLGPSAAHVTIFPRLQPGVHHGIVVHLMHLRGGPAYARSYKLQKILEQMAPEKKPDFLFVGHLHSWAHLPQYRNVNAWTVGCFQAQTEHERRLGLYPELGGLIVEVDIRPDEPKPTIVAVRSELLPFATPIDDDY